jgi:hypothetical protein
VNNRTERKLAQKLFWDLSWFASRQNWNRILVNDKISATVREKRKKLWPILTFRLVIFQLWEFRNFAGILLERNETIVWKLKVVSGQVAERINRVARGRRFIEEVFIVFVAFANPHRHVGQFVTFCYLPDLISHKFYGKFLIPKSGEKRQEVSGIIKRYFDMENDKLRSFWNDAK